MDAARGKREIREVKLGFVRRVHDVPIWIGDDADWCGGETFVDDIGSGKAEMGGLPLSAMALELVG